MKIFFLILTSFLFLNNSEAVYDGSATVRCTGNGQHLDLIFQNSELKIRNSHLEAINLKYFAEDRGTSLFLADENFVVLNSEQQPVEAEAVKMTNLIARRPNAQNQQSSIELMWHGQTAATFICQF
jgi:hypothetical protein